MRAKSNATAFHKVLKSIRLVPKHPGLFFRQVQI